MRTRSSLIAALILPLGAVAGIARRGSTPHRTHPSAMRSKRVSGFIGRPFAVHVTSGGAVLLTEQDINVLRQMDSLATQSSWFEVGNNPSDVVATRDGKLAYVSGFLDGSITIVQLAGDTTSDLVRLPTRNAYRLALSPNESRLYVTSTDGHLYVFNTGTLEVGTSKSLAGSLQGLVLDHAGNNLYVSSTAGDIWRLDRVSLRTLKQAHTDCVAQDVAISTDDRELYVACQKGDVIVLDPRTLDAKDVIHVGPAFGLAVTPDNEQLYVSSPSDGSVLIVDRATRKLICRYPVKGTPRRIAFSPAGDRAYVTNEWNWLSIIE